MSEEYGRHPSEKLNKLFEIQEFPHQGQAPEEALILFVGLDANYSTDISSAAEFFPYILEYQEDGIGFWMKYGVHHPFLLDEYPLKKNTGGVPFHKNFAKMRLPPSFANKISFIELIPYPTTGRTKEAVFWELFDTDHAFRLDKLVFKGGRRLIIFSNSVTRKMQRAKKLHGAFQWLPETFKLGVMKKINETLVFGAPHFSSAVTNQSLLSLGDNIREFCGIEP